MSVSIEDIEALRRELEALPQHQPQSVSKQDAVALLAKQLGAAQRRGYSAEELAQMLSTRGIAINGPTLRGYMQRSRKTRSRSGGKGREASAVATKSAQVTPSSRVGTTAGQVSSSRPEERGRESLTLPASPAPASPKPVGGEAAAATLGLREPRSDKRDA